MRLTDIDALKDRFENLAYDDWNQGTTTTLANAFRKAANVVEDMPTIDAVEVIRCQNCIYSKEYENGGIWCERLTGVFMVDHDGFCKWGE